MPSNNRLNTHDFALAACLLTLGFNNYELDKTNPKKIIFMFKIEPKLEESVDMYWRKELRLEPQELMANTKVLRTRIFG